MYLEALFRKEFRCLLPAVPVTGSDEYVPAGFSELAGCLQADALVAACDECCLVNLRCRLPLEIDSASPASGSSKRLTSDRWT